MFDARAASGSVFSWGRNNNGRLGHGHSQPVSTPEKVKALQGAFITKVACGWSHSLCYSGTTAQAQGYCNPSSASLLVARPTHPSGARVNQSVTADGCGRGAWARTDDSDTATIATGTRRAPSVMSRFSLL